MPGIIALALTGAGLTWWTIWKRRIRELEHRVGRLESPRRRRF